MHIAIEGLDGVGKTQAAKLLAEQYNLTFIQKPLHYLTDTNGMENYLRMMKHINEAMDDDFKALYYGLGNLYLCRLANGINVVTDRYLCSTYFWNQTANNQILFDYLVRTAGLPDLTVILYADAEVRRQRILGRNANDPDLAEKVFPNNRYKKMIEFVQNYEANYVVVDNSEMDLNETVQEIAKIAGLRCSETL